MEEPVSPRVEVSQFCVLGHTGELPPYRSDQKQGVVAKILPDPAAIAFFFFKGVLTS